MKLLACALALFCFLTPVELVAQDSLLHATIDSGTLIRMHPSTGASIRGRLIAPLTPTSIMAQVCRYPAPPCTPASDSLAFRRVPTASLVRVDVQQGSRWGTGAIIGGVFGGVLGGLAGAWANYDCVDSGGGCNLPTPAWAVLGAMAFGGFGALVGSGSPNWKPAP